jgi:hypothetical protein
MSRVALAAGREHLSEEAGADARFDHQLHAQAVA